MLLGDLQRAFDHLEGFGGEQAIQLGLPQFFEELGAVARFTRKSMAQAIEP